MSDRAVRLSDLKPLVGCAFSLSVFMLLSAASMLDLFIYLRRGKKIFKNMVYHQILC